jgi:hypothetical protein
MLMSLTCSGSAEPLPVFVRSIPMSNVEQLANYQNTRDELIAQYLILQNGKCTEWLDQKAYEQFHADAVITMLINIRKKTSRSTELRKAYIDFTMRFKFDDGIEFERLRIVLEEDEHKHLTLDNIRPGQWFHEKKNNYMDIAHAIRQLPSCSLKIDWWDEKCYFTLGEFVSNNLDDIFVKLSEKIHDQFVFLCGDNPLEKAIRMLLLRDENKFNSRLGFFG